MGADNDCEGGIIALLALASAAVVDPTRAVRVRGWNGSSCPNRTAPAPLPERLGCPLGDGVGEILHFCRSSARHTVRPAGRSPLAGQGGADCVMLIWRKRDVQPHHDRQQRHCPVEEILRRPLCRNGGSTWYRGRERPTGL